MPYISQTIPFHSWDYSFGVYPMTPPMSGATCQPLRQLKLRRSWSQYPAARPGEPPTKGLQGGVWQKCGKWWENDGSLLIIYDYLGLSMVIYEYLCLFMIGRWKLMLVMWCSVMVMLYYDGQWCEEIILEIVVVIIIAENDVEQCCQI